MSRDTVSLTYQELADRLGIDVQSARRRALRSKWVKVPGNDGRARVLVPTAVLPAVAPAIGRTIGATDSTAPSGVLPAVAPAEAPSTGVVAATSDALSHLLSQVTEIGDLRERLGRLEVEAAALKQDVTAERMRAEQAEAAAIEQRARAERAEAAAAEQRSRADVTTGEVDGMRLGLEHMQDVLAQARREAEETGVKAEQAARAAKDANERLARLNGRGWWARLRNRS